MRVFMRLDHSVDSLSLVNAALLPPAGGCCRCMNNKAFISVRLRGLHSLILCRHCRTVLLGQA